MDFLERLKTILNVSNQEDLLTEIIELTQRKMLAYLNIEELPFEFDWILLELCIKRYNKIGSEGMKSESTDGVNTTYENNDLEEYKLYFDRYIKEHKTVKEKGWWLL